MASNLAYKPDYDYDYDGPANDNGSELGEPAAKEATRPTLRSVPKEAPEPAPTPEPAPAPEPPPSPASAEPLAGEGAAEGAAEEALELGTETLPELGPWGWVALGVLALGVAGVLVYEHYHQNAQPDVQNPPNAQQPCPKNPNPPQQPDVTPKPIAPDPKVPEEHRENARKRTEAKSNRSKSKCEQLFKDIEDAVKKRHRQSGDGTHGLQYRYFDNICSEWNPNSTDPTPVQSNDPRGPTPDEVGKTEGQIGKERWEGTHKKQYEDQQRGVQRKIQQFQNECEGDLPDGADDWANEEYPDPSEWNGNSPECQQYRQDQKNWKNRPPDNWDQPKSNNTPSQQGPPAPQNPPASDPPTSPPFDGNVA